MAAHVADSVIDNGLASLKADAESLHITTQECANASEVTTYTKGNKIAGAGAIFPGAIAAGTNGRKVTTLNITDGSVTGDGTVTHWAILGESPDVLLAVGSLSASQAVTSGNTFSLAPFDITIKSQ